MRGADGLYPSERPSGVGIVSRLAELAPKRFFLETWRTLDEEAAAERLADDRYDYRPLVVMAVGAVCLTLMEYYGNSSTLWRLVEAMHPADTPPEARSFWADLRSSRFARLYGYTWWGSARLFCYFLIPLLSLRLMGERLGNYGLRIKGFREHAWIYGVAYLVVFACVIVVSQTESFSQYYPFYKLSQRSWLDFALWELIYATQFFSLEFFFRGYWLQACKRTMGSQAIMAMIVPYCMIHFGKPAIEAIAAIVAGVVLGTLALKTRSIWAGFLIHVSVALTMDLAALIKRDAIPTQLLPPGL